MTPTTGVVSNDAEGLHHRDPFTAFDQPPIDATRPGERWVVCELTRPAIILGSRQGDEAVDATAAAAAHYDVTRRRSGGGAVVLHPGDHVWIDTVSEPLSFPDDVRASMIAVGQRWATVLARLARQQVAPRFEVHTGGVVSSTWSDQVCFAGVGPGEVLVNGRKLVGLSQRRTRDGAWFQATVYRRAQPSDIGSLLHPSVPWADLPEVATLADIGLADIDAADLATTLAITATAE